MNENTDSGLPPAQDRPPHTPQGRAPSGNTSSAQGEAQQPAPRMPHERDESADQQAQRLASHERMGRLAHSDREHAVADTSRSVEADQTYHRLREGAPEGQAPPAPAGRDAKARR